MPESKNQKCYLILNNKDFYMEIFLKIFQLFFPTNLIEIFELKSTFLFLVLLHNMII